MNWKIQQQTSPNLNTGNRLREEKDKLRADLHGSTKDLTFTSSDLCKGLLSRST